MTEFWRALFFGPLVILELVLSYFIAPELGELKGWNPLTAGLVTIGIWVGLALVWAVVQDARVREISNDDARRQLIPWKGTHIVLEVGANVPLANQFRDDLNQLLTSAGWSCRAGSVWMTPQSVDGIEIFYSSNGTAEPFEILATVLRQMGYEARGVPVGETDPWLTSGEALVEIGSNLRR